MPSLISSFAVFGRTGLDRLPQPLLQCNFTPKWPQGPTQLPFLKRVVQLRLFNFTQAQLDLRWWRLLWTWSGWPPGSVEGNWSCLTAGWYDHRKLSTKENYRGFASVGVGNYYRHTIYQTNICHHRNLSTKPSTLLSVGDKCQRTTDQEKQKNISIFPSERGNSYRGNDSLPWSILLIIFLWCIRKLSPKYNFIHQIAWIKQIDQDQAIQQIAFWCLTSSFVSVVFVHGKSIWVHPKRNAVLLFSSIPHYCSLVVNSN